MNKWLLCMVYSKGIAEPDSEQLTYLNVTFKGNHRTWQWATGLFEWCIQRELQDMTVSNWFVWKGIAGPENEQLVCLNGAFKSNCRTWQCAIGLFVWMVHSKGIASPDSEQLTCLNNAFKGNSTTWQWVSGTFEWCIHKVTLEWATGMFQKHTETEKPFSESQLVIFLHSFWNEIWSSPYDLFTEPENFKLSCVSHHASSTASITSPFSSNMEWIAG